MSQWKEYKLGELGELARGKSKHRPRDASHLYGGEYPFVQTGDIKAANHWLINYTQTYSEAGLAQSKLWPKGTICITIAANIADSAILKFPACFPDSVIGFIPNKNLCNVDFIEYLLQYYKKQIQSHSIGSVQDNINLGTFQNIKFKLPPLPTQTAIASILSSLDEKIELNNAINRNLEALAQALFKQWFVDFNFPVDEYGNFSPLSGEMSEGQRGYKDSGGEMVESELGMIPKGWRVGKLGEVTLKSNTGADAIQRAPIVDHDTGIRCVRVGDMSNNRNFDKWGFCKIKNDDFKRYKLDIDDIVVTRTASLGLNKIIRRDIKGVYNNGLIRLKIDKTICLPLYIYQDFQNENYKVYIERISGDSSTRPNMQINYLLDYKLIIPTILIQSQFVKQISTIYDSIDSLNEENIRLSSLRDTLLPKLISGELEVNEALTQTEKAV